MLESVSRAGFASGQKDDFLRVGIQKEMQKVPPIPLKAQKFFVLSSNFFDIISKAELKKTLDAYGGMLISEDEVDGPDVICLVGKTTKFDVDWRGDMCYWQPRRIWASKFFDLLNAACAEDLTLPLQPRCLDTRPKKKRKSTNEPGPLTENQNLAGTPKRRAKGIKVEIIELSED